MSVLVGRSVFHAWASLELAGGWTDTFIFRMSPTDGLPPADYAGVVRALASELRKLRPGASIWVQVGAPRPPPTSQEGSQRGPVEEGSVSRAPGPEAGKWFLGEVRHALRGLPVPVAVTRGSEEPQIWDFSYFPGLDPRPGYPPPGCEPLLNRRAYKPSELQSLRVLARADCAYTAEVASLAFLSRTGARKALNALAGRRLIQLEEGAIYPLWQLRRPGLSVALRSWGLPPGFSFRRRKERGKDACEERLTPLRPVAPATNKKEQITFWARAGAVGGLKRRVAFETRSVRTAGSSYRRSGKGRHRRTGRLWPAWLGKALPQAEIWCGWTEVTAGRVRPDALCWGWLDGQETLFWLEVESGHFSRAELGRRTIFRINQALIFARRASAQLVFALLAPHWVREAVAGSIGKPPEDLAILLEDWKGLGKLPNPVWGRCAGRIV